MNGFRRADQLSRRGPAHVVKVDDAQRGAVRINEGQRGGIVPRRDHGRRRSAGKAGYGGIAGRDHPDRRLLRAWLSGGKGGERKARGGEQGP